MMTRMYQAITACVFITARDRQFALNGDLDGPFARYAVVLVSVGRARARRGPRRRWPARRPDSSSRTAWTHAVGPGGKSVMGCERRGAAAGRLLHCISSHHDR